MLTGSFNFVVRRHRLKKVSWNASGKWRGEPLEPAGARKRERAKPDQACFPHIPSDLFMNPSEESARSEKLTPEIPYPPLPLGQQGVEIGSSGFVWEPHYGEGTRILTARGGFVRKPPNSGPLSLAPVSAKSSKNMRFRYVLGALC